MGHGEDAIPAGRRFVEEVVLTALPVRTRGAVIGPLVQDDLKRFLRVFPPALTVEFVSLAKELKTLAHFFCRSVGGILRGAADEFIDDDWLELALHADEIEFAKKEAVVLGGGVAGFVDQDMRAVVFVQTFEAR